MEKDPKSPEERIERALADIRSAFNELKPAPYPDTIRYHDRRAAIRGDDVSAITDPAAKIISLQTQLDRIRKDHNRIIDQQNYIIKASQRGAWLYWIILAAVVLAGIANVLLRYFSL